MGSEVTDWTSSILVPKVTEFDTSRLANENILRFHITMKYSVGMKIEEGRDELAGHTFNHIYIQVFVILQYLKQIPFSKFSHYTYLQPHHGRGRVIAMVTSESVSIQS